MLYDVLILGRGIAGAALAEICRQRGLSAHVFDLKQDGNASLAAAGVVNPVVLRRDVLSWRAEELMPLVETFYKGWQKRMGIQCWHPAPLVKIFPTAHEAAQWERAMAAAATSRFIDRRPEPEIDMGPVRATHGYGTVTASAWLNVPLLLSAQRDNLIRSGQLTEKRVNDNDIRRTPESVHIGEVQGRWLVHCTGPFAEMSGLIPVKGETLTVRIRGLHLARMVHRGIFLLPLGGHIYRIGATFKWDGVWDGSTEEARTWLMERLTALVDAPIEVLDQQWGVRPTTKDRRPILGMLTAQEAVLNGLGSHGVMLAPWCAGHLLDHLFERKALVPEVDRARFD